MNWKEIYKSRLATPEEAIKFIRPGDKIVVAHGPAAPDPILQAMVDNKFAFKDVQISHMLTFGDKPYADEELDPHFHLNVFFVGDKTRTIINKGIGDFTPTHFSEIPYVLRNVIKPDVTLIQVSKPDEHGYVSLGLSVDYSLPSARISRTVIAEVNDKCPRTFGDSFLHVSEIDCFVETSRQVFEYIPVEIGEKEKTIGNYCAELINDGDCLQLGMGAIPDAVLGSLMDKKDLGVHSEIIGDPIIDLIEAGVINGTKKTLHVGKVVVTSIFGTRKLHQYVDNNPVFELYPVDYTNDPCIIAKNANMVSINSCVQVDFMGQICSEAFGAIQYSGIGGQQDFMRGAKMSKGGKGIITFYSTAKNDSISRIVPMMEAGTPITAARTDVDYLVTEYGIASLRGQTLKNRAKSIIKISHPKFKDGLEEAFENMIFMQGKNY